MIKYRIRVYCLKPEIEEVKVIRETKVFVYIEDGKGERREAKKSSYDEYYDSWDDARDALLNKARHKHKRTKALLEETKALIVQIESMKC